MKTAQNISTAPLLRLLFWAGVLDRATMEAHAAKLDTGGKTIVDIMRQNVSLDTFRDLMTAEVSFKSKRGTSLANELHKGLSDGGMINDHELKELLDINRPPAAGMVAALERDGILEAGTLAHFERTFAGDGALAHDRLIAERVLTAERIGQWLGRAESRQMRRAALLMTLHLLHSNKLLEGAEMQELARRVRAGELDDVARLLARNPALRGDGLREFLASGPGVPSVDLAQTAIDPALLPLAPFSLVRRLQFIPYHREGEAICIATADPMNVALVALLEWATGLWPQAVFAPAGEVMNQINARDGRDGAGRGAESLAAGGAEEGMSAEIRRLPVASASIAKPAGVASPPRESQSSETPVIADNVSAVQLVSSIIESAIDLRTTDIHLEPIREGLAVRFRIDGELRRIMTVPPALTQPVASRIKVLADMDVTERRRPQDGHFELNLGRQSFDFRISTLPAMQGEKVVIRILDSARVMTSMGVLGLLPQQQSDFEWMLERPYGMILVTGPTGSGKTSTLYSGLHRLNIPSRNLVTIEDPVEYQLEGITQVQVDSNIGVTFAEGLRSILRQDPDVIMVGEIRDALTAQIAIRAAMTGHIVLSTLHTNTALGAIDALVNLGVVRFMLASSLLGIVSQRLLRVLCEHCKKPLKLTPELRAELGIGADKRKTIRKPQGCEECLKGGYLGRTGIFEIIRVTDKLRPLFAEHHRVDEIEKGAREEGMMSLSQAAVEKLLAGVTSADELRRKILIEI